MSLDSIKKARTQGKEFRIKDLKSLTNLEAQDVYDKELTIIEFDISHTKDGNEYCVVMFKELKNSFYFGKSVLTELCKEIEADDEALDELHKKGLKVIISEATSKSTGRTYETVKFA